MMFRGWFTALALRLAALAGAALMIATAFPAGATPTAPQAGAHSAYLPLIVAPGTAQPGPDQPPPDQPPAKIALFMQADQKVGNPDIEADAQGGTHIGYRQTLPFDQLPAAVYGYCPAPAAQCANAAAWTYIAFGERATEVQLELSPTGQPRLLVALEPSTGGSNVEYYYGECDGGCTQEAGWDWTFVAARMKDTFGEVSSYNQPKRSFALDRQGRPAFVFYDANYLVEPDHYGGYYYSCQADCTTQANWAEARFTHQRQMTEYSFENELIRDPVLAFTPEGHPRVLALLYPLNGTGEDGIYYFACDAGCEDDASWERARVTERGNGPWPAWDLAIDAQGRPRVAFFKYDASDDTAQRLFYLWCDAGCLDAASWQTLNLGLGAGNGLGADLELDAQGRPRIAFLNSFALGYTWCDSGCGQAGSWWNAAIDSDDDMTASYPIPLPITCDVGVWDSYAPSLALDSAGNPRFAYDTSYRAGCLYQDPTDPTRPPDRRFQEIWHSVRVAFETQP